MEQTLKEVIKSIKTLKKCKNEEDIDNVRTFTKQAYDFIKTKELKNGKSTALAKLYVDGLDSEQICQQVELMNNDCFTRLALYENKLKTASNKLCFKEYHSQLQAEKDESGSDEDQTKAEGEEFDLSKDAGSSSEEDDDDNDSNGEHSSDDLQEKANTKKVGKESNFDLSSDDEDEEDVNETFTAVDKQNSDENSDEDFNDNDLNDVENSDKDSDDDDDENSDKDSNDLSEEEHPVKKFKPSVVDDEFFKLNEMNDFLLSEEKQLDKKKTKKDDSGSEDEENEIDLFEDYSDDEEVEENDDAAMDKEKYPRYKDFFRQKEPDNSGTARKRKSDNMDWRDDEDFEQKRKNWLEENMQTSKNAMEKEEKKSSLEQIEERRQRMMKILEEAAVGEKAWHMKGEVKGDDRPVNSALEEVLQFDINSRPAPVITEQTNKKLEDIIRQRIKDKAYDDVIRKEKPIDTPLEFKKKLTLDQEKSKESLAQIYEKEYIKQKEALNADPDKPEDEPPLFNELRIMQHDLFKQLDALTNYRFTPRPAVPELKIISNLPAISMEEVAPVAVSDATLLAPEEIKKKAKGEIMGKAERSKADKKRERRKKKLMQKYKAKQNLNKAKSLQKKVELKKHKNVKKVI